MRASEVTAETVPKINKVSKVKQEDNIKEKKKEIPCRYFHKREGCTKGNKCWFYHDENLEAKKKSKNFKPNPIKKFKDELNIEKKAREWGKPYASNYRYGQALTKRQ